jgi:hypothetical protein
MENQMVGRNRLIRYRDRYVPNVRGAVCTRVRGSEGEGEGEVRRIFFYSVKVKVKAV